MHYWRHLGTVFPFLTLHRGKAWFKKTIANLVLFSHFSCLRLALAALADNSFISSSMVIIFSRFFHTVFKFCCIFMRRETKFLKICFPPSLGSIILPAAPKEFLFKGFFLGPVPVRLPPLKTPLDLQKVVVKPNVSSTFSLFGPSWFEYASKLLFYLNVLPARAGSTFLQIMFNKNPTFRIECASECPLAASGPQSR